MTGDRKAAVRAYKEQRRPMGIYRVRCTANGSYLVGSSVDLPSMLNRQRSQFEMGSHPDHGMQRHYNEFGVSAFAFEVLDELEPPDDPAHDARADLAALLEMWRERLGHSDS